MSVTSRGSSRAPSTNTDRPQNTQLSWQWPFSERLSMLSCLHVSTRSRCETCWTPLSSTLQLVLQLVLGISFNSSQLLSAVLGRPSFWLWHAVARSWVASSWTKWSSPRNEAPRCCRHSRHSGHRAMERLKQEDSERLSKSSVLCTAVCHALCDALSVQLVMMSSHRSPASKISQKSQKTGRRMLRCCGVWNI